MADRTGACLSPEAAQSFASGALAAEVAVEIEAHVDSCDDCRELVRAQARGSGALDRTISGLDTTAAAPLESAPTQLAGSASEPAEVKPARHPPPGTRIDRYVIERPLGAGGMGVVSLADDPELKRKVCLKLLRPELLDPGDTQATRARLLREAQAMAQISHPNVVSLFDIGTCEGQVFIAMEYIEGCDLARWSKQAVRRPDQVVEVLRAAGRGLAAAHQAGLVHRDFKPQNVMVADDGAVKVTDFGLARTEAAWEVAEAPVTAQRTLVRQPDSPASGGSPVGTPGDDPPLGSTLTRTGALVGTPAYMAPEQIRGDPVDARCDQFAFAVTLYELLYGARPFAGSTVSEVFAAATEGAMRPMPRRAGVPRRVRGAIARALRASPADRFASMDELLAALAPPRSGRAVAAVAAALVVGGGVAAAGFLGPGGSEPTPCDGGAALMAAVWGDGPRERIRAGFASTGITLAASTSSTILRDLDAYASAWVGAHREACLATRVREQQSEDMMERRLACLERRRVELAATVEILERPDAEVIEEAYKLPANLSAIEDCADVETLGAPVPLPRDPAQREQIAAIRAQLARAEALSGAQRLQPARDVAEPALAAALKIGWTPLVAEARYAVAVLDVHLARHEEAEKGLHAAAVAAEQGGHDEVRVDTYLALLDAKTARGQYDEALRWADYARAGIERTGSHPGRLGELSRYVGGLYSAKGDLAKAKTEYERAIELLTRAWGADDHRLARVRFDLGNYYNQIDEYDRSIVELEKALAVWREDDGDDNPWSVLTLLVMASVRSSQDRLSDSLQLVDRAMAACQRVYGDDHEVTAGAYIFRGKVLSELGRIDESLAAHEHAIGIFRRAFGHDHRFVALNLGGLAMSLTDAGRWDEAAARQAEAVDILARNLSNSRELIQYRGFLGAIHMRRKDYPAALAEYGRAVAAAEANLAKNDPLLASVLDGVASTYRLKGEAARAVPIFERVLEIERSRKAGPADLADAELGLARGLWDSRIDRARARRLAQQALVHAEEAKDKDAIETTQKWLADRAGK